VPKILVTDGVEWPRMADPTRSTLDTNPPTHPSRFKNEHKFILNEIPTRKSTPCIHV
jgi:hypothetical protein